MHKETLEHESRKINKQNKTKKSSRPRVRVRGKVIVKTHNRKIK